MQAIAALRGRPPLVVVPSHRRRGRPHTEGPPERELRGPFGRCLAAFCLRDGRR